MKLLGTVSQQQTDEEQDGSESPSDLCDFGYNVISKTGVSIEASPAEEWSERAREAEEPVSGREILADSAMVRGIVGRSTRQR